MRYALGLEYDGSAFCGWQGQPSGCGVQDRLESALERFATVPVGVTVAGRTDAGVHASAQVAHFDTHVSREIASWVRGPNTFLDRRIRILWAREVPGEFHARFSARARTYRYLLQDSPVAPGLLQGRVGWFHQPLDVAAMARAAACLAGEHDFSAFRDAQCQARSPVRHLHEVEVFREGDLVAFRFRANAFLHHMIRNIVGTLVYVGAGRRPEGWVAQVLAGRDRRLAAPTFAPDGLYLTAVEYDPSFGLPGFRSTPNLTPK